MYFTEVRLYLCERLIKTKGGFIKMQKNKDIFEIYEIKNLIY